MPTKPTGNPYGGPRREQHGPVTFKEWPAKVLKGPQKTPGEGKKK